MGKHPGLEEVITSDCVQGTVIGIMQILKDEFVVMPQQVFLLLIGFLFMAALSLGIILGLWIGRKWYWPIPPNLSPHLPKS